MGILAEALVAQWLRTNGWQILVERWHCRWGELDLVAFSEVDVSVPSPKTISQTIFPAGIAFVEVKARSGGNWDGEGLLAITPQKQKKLWQTAELFLAEHPQFAMVPCRFDAAFVHCRYLPSPKDVDNCPPSTLLNSAIPDFVELGKPISIGACTLTLQQYVQDVISQGGGHW